MIRLIKRLLRRLRRRKARISFETSPGVWVDITDNVQSISIEAPLSEEAIEYMRSLKGESVEITITDWFGRDEVGYRCPNCYWVHKQWKLKGGDALCLKCNTWSPADLVASVSKRKIRASKGKALKESA